MNKLASSLVNQLEHPPDGTAGQIQTNKSGQARTYTMANGRNRISGLHRTQDLTNFSPRIYSIGYHESWREGVFFLFSVNASVRNVDEEEMLLL